MQGLADTFILMRLPFTSPRAKQLNKEIFETIYYAAMTASKDLAVKEGPYETIKGSPVSKGIFQFDMWNVTPSDRWEWGRIERRSEKARSKKLFVIGTNAYSFYRSNLRKQ